MAKNMDSDLILINYLNAAQRYPVNEFTTCAQLQNMAVNLQAEIDEATRKRASGALSSSNAERYIQGFSQHLQTITSTFQNRDCQEQQTAQDTQTAIDNNLQVLNSAASLAEKTGKTSKSATIVVISMLVLVVLSAGIVFAKKLKKK